MTAEAWWLCSLLDSTSIHIWTLSPHLLFFLKWLWGHPSCAMNQGCVTQRAATVDVGHIVQLGQRRRSIHYSTLWLPPKRKVGKRGEGSLIHTLKKERKRTTIYRHDLIRSKLKSSLWKRCNKSVLKSHGKPFTHCYKERCAFNIFQGEFRLYRGKKNRLLYMLCAGEKCSQLL